MTSLPSYEKLWDVYPDYINYPDPQVVKEMIGGNVNATWITNTCAIRMSRAFNYTGTHIPEGYPGLKTVKGGDDMRYAFRVREMRRWLDATLDKPEFDIKKTAGTVFNKSTVAHIKGLIAFDISFSDATGHLDLWDGSIISSEAHMSRNYYDSATRITIWRAS